MTDTKRLSAKQQTAVDYLRANLTATPGEIIDVAGVKGGFDNQAAFILRLLNTGAVSLYATDMEDAS